jgi:SOS-response transcriptional repressor LexA
VQLCQVTRGSEVVLDLFDEGVSAGSPQPPFGQSAEKVNLNDLLKVNEIATFFCRVSCRSMEPTMRDSDILMMDKSIGPKTKSVVIAAVNGETPLDWAIEKNHTEIADLLRKHGGKTGEELKAEGK